MKHRTIRGKILYPDNDTGETGREWFTITVQPDGRRTLRAQCEMDDRGLLRDVIYSVDTDWYPLDCFVRLSIEERLTVRAGSGSPTISRSAKPLRRRRVV